MESTSTFETIVSKQKLQMEAEISRPLSKGLFAVAVKRSKLMELQKSAEV